MKYWKRFIQFCRWFAFLEMLSAALLEFYGAIDTFPKMWFGPSYMWDWPFWVYLCASFWFMIMARYWWRRARRL